MDYGTSQDQLVRNGGGNVWDRRTKLEKILLGLSAVAVVACVALVAVVATNGDSTAPNRYKPKAGGLPVYHVLTENGEDLEICSSLECTVAAANIIEALDTSVDPCDDFYKFACQGWIDKNPVPESSSRWTQFDFVGEELVHALRKIIQEPISSSDSTPITKSKTYYQSCLNESRLEELGLKPLTDFLESYGGWPMTLPNWSDDFDWQGAVADARDRLGAGLFVNVWVFADQKSTDETAIYIDQTSLGMPRTVLTNPSSYEDRIQAYKKYMEDVATLVAESLNNTVEKLKIHADVEEVVKFEMSLANITTPAEDRRDVDRMYNPMNVSDLDQMTSAFNIDWDAMLTKVFASTDVKIDGSTRVIVQEKEYLTKLGDLLNSTDSRVLSNYILWRHVKSLGDETTQCMRDASFEYHMVSSGVTASHPRWRECVDRANSHLGIALGTAYVKEYFPEQTKKDASEMVEDLRSSFKDLLGKNEWMDDDTKPKAMEKAEAIKKFIAYPDWYGNASALASFHADLENITLEAHFENTLTLKKWKSYKELSTFGHATNREEWFMPPAMVNAYYMPEYNSITFPAGILQAPFYRANSLQALNYGGIGQVMGHEITHGFDDQGRQNDKLGNAIPWWNNATLQAFKSKAQCIVDQYSDFHLPELDGYVDNATVNGVNTQGENIADNGGLREALFAYRKYVDRNGEEPRLPGLENYSPEQLFFIANANLWCGSITNQGLLNQILTDPHSPSQFRVNGPMSNMEEFSKIWSCKDTSLMNRPKKCVVWFQVWDSTAAHMVNSAIKISFHTLVSNEIEVDIISSRNPKFLKELDIGGVWSMTGVAKNEQFLIHDIGPQSPNSMVVSAYKVALGHLAGIFRSTQRAPRPHSTIQPSRMRRILPSFPSRTDIFVGYRRLTMDYGISQDQLVRNGGRNVWDRRTKLEKILLGLSAVAVVACVALVTVVATNGDSTPPNCTRCNPKNDSEDLEICSSLECTVAAANIIEALDTSVDPCDDFYKFACQGWIDKNPVPESSSRWTQFDFVGEELVRALRKIIQEPISSSDSTPITKSKTYYQSCLNESRLEELGLQPLTDFLESYGGWPMTLSNWSDDFDWQGAVADARDKLGAGLFVSVVVQADQKSTDETAIYIDQTTLGMPRTVLTDPSSYEDWIQAYKKYMEDAATLVAESLNNTVENLDIRADVEEVVNFEMSLANITTPAEDRRDVDRMYNPMNVSDLDQITSAFDIDWDAMLTRAFASTGIEIDGSTRVIVQEEEYLTMLGDLLNSTDSRVLSNYILWRQVMFLGDETTRYMRDASFEYLMVSSGVTASHPRWRECIYRANFYFGIALGTAYVEEYFSEETKKAASEMVEDLRSSFKDLLGKNEWMDDDTRPKAMEKAEAMKKFIAYPDWYGNASVLESFHADLENITLEAHFENTLTLLKWRSYKELSMFGNATDREVWITTPTVVNAYYMPEYNSITLPAGILQAPFYRANSLQALNYGGIGQVMGHEITHGFDDQGRQNDKFGNAIPWWNNATIQAFKSKVQCIIDQYDDYHLPELDDYVDNATVDGVITLGENIADNGGLREAFFAYRKYVDRNGEEPRLPGLENYSPEQLFFIANANLWCGSITNQGLLTQILTNPHSPGQFRVNGPMSNMEEFSEIWSCNDTSLMNRPMKCVVW
ncbi:uncharacterized protein LOC143022352 [Oratosquilla oratoria]|uniref:uncharacterized protein LOC143022352 n=1 Tax=Oratosquilla oratoria TaxID=337810 RepID=UPI003F766B2A